MDKVSASSLWFSVTIIPKVIHAEIISVGETSIIVAISFAVTNSVTFNILLSSSSAANSSSDFCLCWSLLSFLYLAALPLEDLPCNFSNVSLICCWTSSSLGSSLEGLLNLSFCLDFELDTLFWKESSCFDIILLLLFLDLVFGVSGCFSFSSSKSIFSPVDFRPESFL